MTRTRPVRPPALRYRAARRTDVDTLAEMALRTYRVSSIEARRDFYTEHPRFSIRDVRVGELELAAVARGEPDRDPSSRHEAAVEVAAYRVALEALTNVARHARASSCAVRVRTDEGLELEVEDDGVGIAERAGTGLGMRSMRERVAELGGRFSVTAGPQAGTLVRAWFPVPDGAAS